MKNQKWVAWASKGFVVLSALSFLYVSVLGLTDPQGVMDLVGVELTNNDALSSIRGVYGGVGMSIVIMLIYFLVKDVKKGLIFLSLIWGFYAFSRLMTMVVDGALADFGTQWLYIESFFFLLAVLLLSIGRKSSKTVHL